MVPERQWSVSDAVRATLPCWASEKQETLDAAGEDHEVVTAEKEVQPLGFIGKCQFFMLFSSRGNSTDSINLEHVDSCRLWTQIVCWVREPFHQTALLTLHISLRHPVAPPTGWRVSEANKKKYMRKLERIFCDIDVSGHETMALAVR